MSRTIRVIFFSIILGLFIAPSAFAQEILLQSSDPTVVQASKARPMVINVFQDRDSDGIPDALTIGDQFITGLMKVGDAQGFQFMDERKIVLYPCQYTGLPAPGTKVLLGFIHYFDDKDISTYLAIVAEQAVGDETTNGTAVFFHDSAGLRVGAPITMFMEKAKLRAIPIYQEWKEMGLDFGIGTNPVNSQFFVYAKELGLTDHILVVMYQLYQ